MQTIYIYIYIFFFFLLLKFIKDSEQNTKKS